MFRESDECKMKVDKEDTARHLKHKSYNKIINQSFVGSYTTAL